MIGRKLMKVLVVEDGRTTRMMLRSAVESLGHECLTAADGSEAWELFRDDADVIAACKRVKDAGYMMALDDFAFGPEYAPLLPYADIIKVDFLATTPEQRAKVSKRYANKGRTELLASLEAVVLTAGGTPATVSSKLERALRAG